MSKSEAAQHAPQTAPPTISPAPSGRLQCQSTGSGLAAPQRSAPAVPAVVGEVLRAPGRPLDPATRAQLEPRFGHDFSRVQVHTDARAAQSAAAVQAQAYTVGQHIVFGAGRYAPHSPQGQGLIGHELAHTIQQQYARLPANGLLAVSIPGDAVEQQADHVAAAVLAGAEVGPITDGPAQLARQVSTPIATEAPRRKRRKGPPFPPLRTMDVAPETPALPYEGTIFLPGPQHSGHTYNLQGQQIVEKQARGPAVPVATIDPQGNYHLLGPDGQPSPSAQGAVAGLTGTVTQGSGKNKQNLTRATSTGQFHLTTKQGADRLLEIKEGGVYVAVGKTHQLVGSVTAAGQYSLILDGDYYTGQLRDLSPGRVKATLARAVGNETIEQLEIGQEAVTFGIIYFDDGRYIARNGQLFRDNEKAAVGQITVVRNGSGKQAQVAAINYRYNDANKKQHSGNLLAGDFAQAPHTLGGLPAVPAGEGTVLKIGSGGGKRLAFVDQTWKNLNWTVAKKGYEGFELFGGGPLETRLRSMRTAKQLVVTDDEIAAFQKVSENESSGQVACVNTWDDMVLSFGFKQWTLGAGEIQQLIAQAPTAFARYGIRLSGTQMAVHNKGTVAGIAGVQDAEDLRSAYWADKFLQAGLDAEVIAAEVVKARRDLQKVLKQMGRSPLLQTARIRNILLELDNNRPSYVSPVIDRTAKQIDDTMSEAEIIDVLDEEIQAEYVKWRKAHHNGATDDEARQKGHRIVAR